MEGALEYRYIVSRSEGEVFQLGAELIDAERFLLTPMDIRSLLQANNDKLLRLYKENLHITLALQATLIEDVLPHIKDELQLDADIVDWANEWLEDTGVFTHNHGS
jgi:hypothetical protein